jgi:putative sigma-54 modulation protein
MNLRISARNNVEVPESLKAHVSRQIEGLTRYFDRILDVDVTFGQERHIQHADVRLHVNGKHYQAEASGESLKVAVDAVVEKLRRQLARHKSKRRRQSLRPDELFLAGKTADDGGALPVLPELPNTEEVPRRLRKSRAPRPKR